jgi:hypothetical protein
MPLVCYFWVWPDVLLSILHRDLLQHILAEAYLVQLTEPKFVREMYAYSVPTTRFIACLASQSNDAPGPASIANKINCGYELYSSTNLACSVLPHTSTPSPASRSRKKYLNHTVAHSFLPYWTEISCMVSHSMPSTSLGIRQLYDLVTALYHR